MNLGGIGIFFIGDDLEIGYSYNITKSIIIKDINSKLDGIPKKSDLIIDNIELYAIYQSLIKLKKHNKKYDKVIIYTDSDVAFLFINNLNRTKKGNIRTIKNLLSRKLTSLIQRMIIELDNDIEIRSVKSHSNIYGNVMSDQLAGNWRKQWSLSLHNNKSKILKKDRTQDWENNLIKIVDN